MLQLELKDVSVFYNEVCALEKINLKISKGDFLGIIGPNGGGKSTLLKVIIGIVDISGGEILRSDSLNIGYVPQFASFNKDFPIRVYDVILMGRLHNKLKLFKVYSEDDHLATKNILEKLSITHLAKRHISELSGGQLQKVLIARAIVSNPNLLILDEPTASLDGEARGDIYRLLKELNSDMTIMVVSHDMAVVSSYVRQVACLNKSLYYHGDTESIGDSLERAYGCPVDVIAHGKPHRVFLEHGGVRI